MAHNIVDDIISALRKTNVSPTGVSFAGKSLKLDTTEDAQEIIEAINNCGNLEFLNLEGNTLGVEASKGIAKILEKHPELKRAQWKDMFTGRMKTEIPRSLEFLGNGLATAGTRLIELDLSDNALGPIGVEGLASFLRGASCFALEELRLNNNGLGITGGKMIAKSLTDCYQSSKTLGKPMALKVFIAGRNRLENDGAKALAEVFKMIGTLEEIVMPQNGIYHIGIGALSEAFIRNKNLKIINLNDNTITHKGAKSLEPALRTLQNLKTLNFGDCLLKTAGAKFIAKGLEYGHEHLEEVYLDYNEIGPSGGIELAKVVKKKPKIKILSVNGNHFGENGREELKKEFKTFAKSDILGSLSEDDSGDEEDGDNEDAEGENSETESDDESPIATTKSVSDFLKSPNLDNFLALGDNRDDLILKETKKTGNISVETFIPILMQVAGLSTGPKDKLVLTCTEKLFKELFTWSTEMENTSSVNNTILVNMGLIKSEDKKFQPSWNVDGCLKALENVIDKPYLTSGTKDVLSFFLNQQKNITR